MRTFGWLEVQLIGELLAEKFPDRDPLRTGFPELRKMVMSLDGFEEEAGHPSNERILEEIQRHWITERAELTDEE
jgi:FeS assembly protein IscX